MYGCGSWTSNSHKESWEPKNWSFWIVVLEKALESPVNYKEIQSVHPKEISPEYSSEGLMLKLKLQHFGHLMWRTDSFEKTMMLGKIEGRRRRGQRGWDGWMASLTWCTWVCLSSRSWWCTGKPGVPQSMGSKESDTELNLIIDFYSLSFWLLALWLLDSMVYWFVNKRAK